MFSFIWKKASPQIIPLYKSQYIVTHVLPLMWIEHCVECAAPLCYSTCKLFKLRSDGRCLRFENGVVPINFEDNHWGGQIYLRRWAKIQARLPIRFIGITKRRNSRLQSYINKTGILAERIIGNIPWHRHRPSKVVESLGLLYLQKNRFSKDIKTIDGFLATVYNHQAHQMSLVFEVDTAGKVQYRKNIDLNLGWNEIFIPATEFPIIEGSKQWCRLYLNQDETGMLTFMNLDFVSISDSIDYDYKPAKKVKCVAWDLDNTLWDGVIGDDLDGKVTINSHVLDIIKTLDSMGILQTIVSKNNFDIAWKKIEELGIGDYFLYPAINWGRKSQNLLTISKELNINIDSFALIDDSSFERHEVKAALPQVRVYDINEIGDILNKPEFKIKITSESANRRESYMAEMKRRIIKSDYGDDYDRFLSDCRMKLEIYTPQTKEDKDRCLELLQRSHQYNISNKELSELDYYALYDNGRYRLYALHVSDIYGDYGIVGFVSILVEKQRLSVKDFVMSCRVAQKKVERAFYKWLVDKMNMGSDLLVSIVKTDRNMPLQEELKKMPFDDIKETPERISFTYRKGMNDFIEDHIIEVSSLGS